MKAPITAPRTIATPVSWMNFTCGCICCSKYADVKHKIIKKTYALMHLSGRNASEKIASDRTTSNKVMLVSTSSSSVGCTGSLSFGVWSTRGAAAVLTRPSPMSRKKTNKNNVHSTSLLTGELVMFVVHICYTVTPARLSACWPRIEFRQKRQSLARNSFVVSTDTREGKTTWGKVQRQQPPCQLLYL